MEGFYCVSNQPEIIVLFCGTCIVSNKRNHIGILANDQKTFVVKLFTDLNGFTNISQTQRSYMSFVMQALYLNSTIDYKIKKAILKQLQQYIANEVSNLKHTDAIKRLSYYLGLAQACSIRLHFTECLLQKYLLHNAKDNLYKACVKRLMQAV